MSLALYQVTTNSSSATPLLTDSVITDPVTGERNFAFSVATIIIQNTDSTNAIYVGTSAVTSSTGIKVAAGASLSIDAVSAPVALALNAISASGTPVVNILAVQAG